MGPEELSQVVDSVTEAVSGAVSPLADAVSGLSAAPEAGSWVFGEAQFSDLMTLGTHVLLSNVVMCALSALACGILLGVLLTQHWRP